MNLIKKIQENVFRHELFGRGASAKGGSASGGKIVVGVSGGPDSVCLLDALYKLKNKYDLEIIVAHVNYSLRGKDSEKDEALVKKIAEKYSLPVEIKNVQRSAFSIQRSEDYLRNIRYNFFEKIREKYGADAIAVGHNLNDQAETVLMRILRGTGLRGLGAIKFKNGNIIRPLLSIPRKEILAYLRKNKLPFRTDKTNLGADFTRNKIRNKLLPYIVKEYNPNIEEVLCRLSQSAAEDHDFITRFSKEWLESEKNLRASRLGSLHPAIQREILRLAIERYNPHLREIESGHIDEILKIIKSRKSKKHVIKFKKLKIQRKGDKLNIEKL
ncbi:MAG: tRNA(Ile)-lysidine synthase [Candidatus Moranbacteria bacterium GW2011_GWC1_45_18]|nr:MAG: tRNA(Ile)-lysidine synthase [Candidatus Moranbacteria bacterium GW2011_GWC2_40_12]KKU00726.1 MAG: tRNA(Ile)-lysidine synthase [Candidatus Moranbacteria bacterium GW2011_GWC1_45_18]OGI35825.1 MAG: tRNA lysidine(34) synthetase TilS [Candidatus Moranbacteria bacterium RIFOXYC1_FULL_44_8]OGI41848.1 MAG: tRNA lysidine(34) synthetase TilS [Candidatus Moranbacteria bacterium RIFOXYD1_FULL_44_9]HBB37275.1 tRNA lysidine(34) synthetase TilS [Candidatus Moranbacteria bacterium]